MSLFQILNGSFHRGKTPIFSNLNLQIEQGHFYGLIGPNGSGKSTLIDLLTGCIRLNSGNILFRNKDLLAYPAKTLAKEIALVPQAFANGFDFSVFDIVLMGRHPHIQRFARPSSNDYEIVKTALRQLDILHLQDRLINQLSGGEQQRVAVARALAQQTPILFLDEATANLDIRHSLDIFQAIRHRVAAEGVTVIAAIHDLNLAAAFCKELIVLKDQYIFKQGKTQEILTSGMIHEVFQVHASINSTGKRLKIDFDIS